MFKKVTPEEVGISSEAVENYIKKLEQYKLSMHSVLMAKGDKIFAEFYWQPFNENTKHRMYSQTKSYVGIAVSQLAADGKINLDDKIIDYFKDKLPENVHPYLQAQTIRHMLTMHTCMVPDSWFADKPTDRVLHYFNQTPVRYPGTCYSYDSEGSFVLGALAERVTGKSLLDYLREKCLDEIGFAKDAYCLKAPGGHTWGDSALICTPKDMLRFGRLIANGGEWNGKQLLNREAVLEATSRLVDNSEYCVYGYSSRGYGHQIWQSYREGFAFYGMHDQCTVYDKKSDIILVFTAGNIAVGASREIIIRSFFDVAEKAAEKLPENQTAYKSLQKTCSDLKLPVAEGEKSSDTLAKINKVKYIAEENACGITEFTVSINGEYGEFSYKNAQGDKTIKFGIGYNEFYKFPQTGYSKDVGSESCPGHMYDCCASAAWNGENMLMIKVQIIDTYIGWLTLNIGFNSDYAVLSMHKMAEDFLNEYSGYVTGKKE